MLVSLATTALAGAALLATGGALGPTPPAPAGAAPHATAARPEPAAPATPATASVDADRLAARLAEAIRFRTVSVPVAGVDAGVEFAGFHAWIARSFPRVGAGLAREVVAGRSLLYSWQGTDASLRPLVLLSHQDVVPAEEGAGSPWRHPPFAGVVEDGFVFGRGAVDDKAGVVGLLEACEHLLAAGFAPARSVILAFGHDEENSGDEGAAALAALLRERDVVPELVLDEGGFVTTGIAPGARRPVALVGTAEKGAAYVELSVRNDGPAHSSSPARDNPVALLARALVRIDQQPWPTRLVPATRTLLEALAPETSGALRFALSNLWLAGPLVRWRLAQSPGTNALVRTTAVGTRLVGGIKDSAIPDVARASVSVRILPGDSVAGVVEGLRERIADPRVEVRPLRTREPSPTSPADSEAFALVRRSIEQVFPDAAVAPGLFTGGTDARYYVGLTPNVFRFLPLRASLEDLRGVHGTDERIAVAAYADAVRFYVRLIEGAAGPGRPVAPVAAAGEGGRP
jgi:carboxypeptidase PM20D1